MRGPRARAAPPVRPSDPDAPPPTEGEVNEWLAILFEPEQVIEVRAPKTARPGSEGEENVVIRFKAADLAVVARKVLELSGHAPAIYVVLNGIDPNLPLGRRKDGANAGNIPRRRWLLVDCDPNRQVNGTVNATDAEKAAAYAVAMAIRAALVTLGWPEPIVADSGNGYHLLFRVDLPNDDPSTGLSKGILVALAARFNTPECHVDTGVHDAPRLVKCYGTWACKGEDTSDRPARYARVLSIPAEVVPVPAELLGALAAEAGAPASPKSADTPRAGADGTMPVIDPRTATDTPDSWLKTQLATAYGRIATAPIGERHATVLAQTRWVAGFLPLNLGFTESELEAKMIRATDEAAPERKGDNLRCVRDAIEHGKASPLDLPKRFQGDRPGGGSVSSVGPSDHTHARNGAQNGGCVGSVSPSPYTRPVFSTTPRPIVADLRPVPEFKPELLPEPFRTWALDIANRAQCSLEYVAVGMVIALATVVGRKVGIRPKRHDFWLVVANLWGMIVGRPGVLKTHALEEALAALRRLSATARERHAEAYLEYQRQRMVADAQSAAAKDALKKAAKKAGKDDAGLRKLAEEATSSFAGAPPTERRYVTNDATVEKLGELLRENPNGILQFRDELSGFLRSFEKQNRQMDRPFYLEGWNGTGSYTYDRIERGTIHIPALCLSLLGGIQPGPLASYLRVATSADGDDGFISRFQLAVYPDQDRPFRVVDRVPNLDARERVFAVFQALDELDPATIGAEPDDVGGIPFLRFDDDAQSFFYRWFETLETTKLRANESPVIESHLSKYRSLMPSLALLFHLVYLVYEGMAGCPVSLPAAKLAASWCEIFEEHARRIYQHAADGDIQPALTLAERLKASLPSPFVARDVQRKCWKNLGTAEEVQLALSVLEERGWVVSEEVPAGERGGRPTVQYHVHPSIMTGQETTEKNWGEYARKG
jgi:hypothetical protein